MKAHHLSLLLSVLLAVGCGTSATTSQSSSGFDSPQAAFDAMTKAANAGDWKSATQAMTPESHNTLAQGMLIPAALMAGFDEKAGKELEAIFEKHGVDGDSVGDFDELPVEDKPAFIADLAKLMNAHGGEASDMGLPSGQLSELKVDGDTATATIDGESIAFRKLAGGWLVHIDPSEVTGGANASATLSHAPLAGTVAGKPFQAKFAGRDSFGGFKIAGEEDPKLGRAKEPQILFSDSWEPMAAGEGALSGTRNITFYDPEDSSNVICMSGKYKITDSESGWVMQLYAKEGADNEVNGQVIFPKTADK